MVATDLREREDWMTRWVDGAGHASSPAPVSSFWALDDRRLSSPLRCGAKGDSRTVEWSTVPDRDHTPENPNRELNRPSEPRCLAGERTFRPSTPRILRSADVLATPTSASCAYGGTEGRGGRRDGFPGTRGCGAADRGGDLPPHRHREPASRRGGARGQRGSGEGCPPRRRYR